MADQPSPRIGAAGIGVTDLARSVEFYQQHFGMKQVMDLNLPDMDEVILGFRGGQAALVLMAHHDATGHDYTNTGGKVVFYVEDPVAVADAIAAGGGEMVMRPEPVAQLGNAMVGFVKDPDGHLIELLQG